ncbi:MAG: CsgE family curli-type amyloid fiber assembly protein [Bordetella sp.]|uniref:CsgE family curli-type amyloid fiber assembly protein n=1 Tax=Bordetella sp. TaxID=28081 RepID=UPI003F7B5ABC
MLAAAVVPSAVAVKLAPKTTAPNTAASNPAEPNPPNGKLNDQGDINSEPLAGLVINRTKTVLGWDFYSNFASLWSSLHPESRDNLTIIERPTAQFGSEISITFANDTVVYHVFLPPTRSRVQEQSSQAVQVVSDNIIRIEVQRKIFKDFDLGPEEL